jgi:hypothetical protein
VLRICISSLLCSLFFILAFVGSPVEAAGSGLSPRFCGYLGDQLSCAIEVNYDFWSLSYKVSQDGKQCSWKDEDKGVMNTFKCTHNFVGVYLGSPALVYSGQKPFSVLIGTRLYNVG